MSGTTHGEYSLTPMQLKEIETIMGDKRSQEQTLRTALNFHANMRALINKKEKEWWDNFFLIHGLDKSVAWEIDTGGVDVIVRRKIEEKEN